MVGTGAAGGAVFNCGLAGAGRAVVSVWAKAAAGAINRAAPARAHESKVRFIGSYNELKTQVGTYAGVEP